MHRLTYHRTALAVMALVAAVVVSELPARGAPPVRAMPPRQPVFTPQPIVTANILFRDAAIRYNQMLPSRYNLNASLVGNPIFTPLSGLTPYSPALTGAAYWQTAYNNAYLYPMSWNALNSYPMSYSMYGYGSPYSGYGAGYGGGGGSASAPDTDRAELMAGVRPERREVPIGPLSGLMKVDGGLDWPLALRILPPAPEAAELRRQLDSRAAELQGGKADGRLVRDMNRDLDRLTTLLTEKADRLPVSEQATTDARQFIRKLREALKGAE